MYAWALTLCALFASSLTLRAAACSGRRASSSSKSSSSICLRAIETDNVNRGHTFKQMFCPKGTTVRDEPWRGYQSSRSHWHAAQTLCRSPKIERRRPKSLVQVRQTSVIFSLVPGRDRCHGEEDYLRKTQHTLSTPPWFPVPYPRTTSESQRRASIFVRR